MQHRLVSLSELRIAEKPEQLNGSEFAALLPDLAHLQYREVQTADDDDDADDFRDVGEHG